MTRAVYVLGAGFSKGAGGPLVRDFSSETFLKGLRSKLGAGEQRKFDKVTKHMLDKIKGGWCQNIEEILSHMQVAEQLGLASLRPQGKKLDSYDAGKLREDLEWYIEKAIDLMMDKEPKPCYKRFLMNMVKDEDTLITFNYDTLVERIFRKENRGFHYWLNENDEQKGSLLLKLHGSLNWIYCIRCEQLWELEGPFARRSSFLCRDCGKSDKLRTLIVPPILDKSLYLTKKEEGDFDLMAVWQQAIDSIRLAEKIVFIGYSLSDTDFYARKLFQIGINMNHNYHNGSLNIILVNTNSETLIKYSSGLNVPTHYFETYLVPFEEYAN
ncbi:MAG: SIR2 family protein [Nitrososphaerales archaeon]